MQLKQSDFNFLYHLIKAHNFDTDDELIWVTFPISIERSIAKLIPSKFLELLTYEQKEKLLIGDIDYTEQKLIHMRNSDKLIYRGTTTMIATSEKYCVFQYMCEDTDLLLRVKFKPLEKFFGDISEYGLPDLEYIYNRITNTLIICYNNRMIGILYNAFERW